MLVPIKKKALLLAFSFAVTAPLIAQAKQTAVQEGEVQIGVMGSYVNPDYTQATTGGVKFFADYDLPRKHLGAEAEVEILLPTAAGVQEVNYFVGPKVTMRIKRTTFFARGMVGLGGFESRFNERGGYFAMSIGAGIDFRVTPHIVIRPVDLQFEDWPSFSDHGLTPYSLSAGVAYHF